MTDKQRLVVLEAAIKELKLTKVGFPDKNVKNSHWDNAMDNLNRLKADLKNPPPPPPPKPKVPEFGPVYNGGNSFLTYQLTHNTDGIEYYPAFDTAFAEGMGVLAPEDLLISRSSSSRPGLAFYAIGPSKLKYWFGHLDRSHNAGERFDKGEMVGRVAHNNVGGGPHCHIGVNIEELVGRRKQLKFGKYGNGPDYTFGSPSIGKQLLALMEDV